MQDHADWLHFRSRVPHALRREPDESSPRITWIGLDHKLVLRELRGDWMRVGVEQPDLTCGGEPDKGTPVLRHEGWVKWRDDRLGPWVWVYTRGC